MSFFCVTLKSGGRATKMWPVLDQLAHLAEEERQQQRADVLAVHVGVGQDDDLAVADLGDVLGVADVHADGGDQAGDLLVLEQLLEAGLLDVEHLAAQRQDGLDRCGRGRSRPSRRPSRLRRGTARSRRGRGGAVHELAGQAAAAEDLLAVVERVAGLLRRDPGLGGEQHLLADPLRLLRVLLQVLGQDFVDDAGDDAVDLGVVQLDLRLRFELGSGWPMLMTAVRPSRKSSPLEFERPSLEVVFLLAVGRRCERVRPVRKPERCVPPSGL